MQHGFEFPDEFMTLVDIGKVMGCSPTGGLLRIREAHPGFPAPVGKLSKAFIFQGKAVQAWLDDIETPCLTLEKLVRKRLNDRRRELLRLTKEIVLFQDEPAPAPEPGPEPQPEPSTTPQPTTRKESLDLTLRSDVLTTYRDLFIRLQDGSRIRVALDSIQELLAVGLRS